MFFNKEVDHYSVLGLNKQDHVTDADVKQAYHKLAKEYHPDLNKGIGAAERFRLINHSYEAINTKEKRSIYVDNLHDSDSWNLHNRGSYGGRSNYTDVSGDFNRAFDQQAKKASTSRWNKFVFRSLMTFEKIVHPTYLFGVVFPVLGISYYLSSTLKQRIGFSNDNNSYNNKYKYTQHNTIFSTNKATVPSEWYNTQAKPWETVASRKKKTANTETESVSDKTKPKKKKIKTNTTVSKTTKVKKKKKKKKVAAAAKAT